MTTILIGLILYFLGCGPLCIYPLLGTHLNQWKFLATEIQSESIQSAKENIARNNFDNKITGF